MFNYFELNNPKDFQYLLNSAGEDITINGNPTRALITNTNLNENSDNKKITTLDKIERGFLIDYNGYKWLVTSEVNGMRYSKYKGLIQKCNYDVIFNFEGVLKTFPAIIEGKVFDVQEGKYVYLPTGKVVCMLQENVETLAIALDQRFIKMGSAWKVTGIDRTKNGLITLFCDLDLFNADDERENEIADANKYVYALSIAEAPTATVYVDNTLQLTTSLTLNGVTSDKPLQFVSSDSSIASVSETGLITAITEGDAVITVSMVDMPEVQATITITVDVLVVDNITYELNGNLSVQTEVKLNQTQTYTAVKKNNGVVVPDATFTFSVIPGTTASSAFQFVIINSTQASIKTLQYTYYITLRATDDADPTQYVEKYIKLRGII